MILSKEIIPTPKTFLENMELGDLACLKSIETENPNGWPSRFGKVWQTGVLGFDVYDTESNGAIIESTHKRFKDADELLKVWRID